MARRSRMLFSSSTTSTRVGVMSVPSECPNGRWISRPDYPRARAVGGGQGQGECGALADAAADLDEAAVLFQHAVDQGQADAAALGLRGEERLEDVLHVRLWDAAAAVRDPDLEAAAAGPQRVLGAHPHVAAVGHGLDGVQAEVPDGLP